MERLTPKGRELNQQSHRQSCTADEQWAQCRRNKQKRYMQTQNSEKAFMYITRSWSSASGEKTWKWKSFNEAVMTGCLFNCSTKLISIT